MYPWIDQLVLDVLDIEYHETIMAAAGQQAEENLHNAVEKYKGKFICVVEGAVATKFNGAYGKVGGKTFLQIAKEVCTQAAGVICIGSCSAYGNIPAAKPNPGGYKGVGEVLGIKTVNIAGCPPNPINFVGTVVNYLLLGKLPALDDLGRPQFAYGQTIHDNCRDGATLKTRNSSRNSGPKRPRWATASSRSAAAGLRPTTTVALSSSTTAPAGRFKRGIPASAAASRISGQVHPFYQEL